MFNRKFFTLLSLPIFLQCGNPKEQDSNKNEGVTLNDTNNIFSDQLTEFKIKLEKIKICSKDSRGKELKKLEVETKRERLKTFFQHIFSCVKKNSTNPASSEIDDIYKQILRKIKQDNMNQLNLDSKNFEQEFYKGCQKFAKKFIAPINQDKFGEEIKKIFEQFICAKKSYDCLIREFCSNYL